MARIVKLKLVVITFSVLLLTAVILYKDNFFIKDEFLEYRQLGWEDFHGFQKPFSKWGASIDSRVFIEYDSSLNRYRAFAAMNSNTSRKKSGSESEYLLKHEQYHFNLTHYYALKLDKQLNEETTLSQTSQKLNAINNDLKKAQNRYDLETDHNLIVEQQGYWEFKIDSLINSINGQQTLLGQNLYTNLEFFNINGFKRSKEFTSDGAFQTYYEALKYEAFISINSIKRTTENDITNFEESVLSFYEGDSVIIDKTRIEQITDHSTFYVYTKDTVRNSYRTDKWLANREYLHILRVQTNNSVLKEGHKMLFNSLETSFRIRNQEASWGQIVDSTEPENMLVEKYDESHDHECLVIDTANTLGFIPYLIRNKEEDLIIPYTPVIHADSLISTVVAIHLDRKYNFDMSDSIALKIDKEHLGERVELFIGYILKSDTINECLTFYNQRLILEKVD